MVLTFGMACFVDNWTSSGCVAGIRLALVSLHFINVVFSGLVVIFA